MNKEFLIDKIIEKFSENYKNQFNVELTEDKILDIVYDEKTNTVSCKSMFSVFAIDCVVKVEV